MGAAFGRVGGSQHGRIHDLLTIKGKTSDGGREL